MENGCAMRTMASRSEEHTSELQSRRDLVCRLLLEKKTHRSCQAGHRTCSPRNQDLSCPGLLCHRIASLHSLHLSLSFLNPSFFFFFNDTATTEIYTLSLHDALPI